MAKMWQYKHMTITPVADTSVDPWQMWQYKHKQSSWQMWQYKHQITGVQILQSAHVLLMMQWLMLLWTISGKCTGLLNV